MKKINALELRKHFGQVMDEVRYRKEPCIVTKNGRSVMVLLDIDSYMMSKERLDEEAFIEEYSEERIAEFLKEDSLDEETAKKIRGAVS